MAGTVTVSEITLGSVKKITWAWTTDSNGDADKVTSEGYSGEIILLTTDPGATAPTDNYDVVVLDADGEDVLLGAGANRDTLNTESVQKTSLGAVASGILNCIVSNAGNAKDGECILYIR